MRLTTGYGPDKPEIWHASEMSLEERRKSHGEGSYQPPEALVAGEFTTVSFEFCLGANGLAVGGVLGVAWRWPFDWSALQTDDPRADGYVCWTTRQKEDATPAMFVAKYEAYGGIEPYHHYLALELKQGTLQAGDTLRVVCGETRDGGRGWRAPTCAAREARFLMLVAPEGKQRWTELPPGPAFAINPGPPSRLVLIAPSDVVVGETAAAQGPVVARVEDRWGNATSADEPPTLSLLEGQGFQCRAVSATTAPPAYHYDVSFDRPGTYRLEARLPGASLTAVSNPIRAHAQAPERRVFWGDLHSGQSLIGCGAGSLAEHYAYGRDAAGLQFITHQANDHYVTTDDWQETRRETEAFYQPGRYIAMLGCEWSPATFAGGDRNVIYRRDEPRLRRSDRFFTESTPDPEPDVPTAPEFHEAFRNEDVLVNIHVGGRPTNLQWHEPAIELLAETHSTHGTSEWFFQDCLQRGFRVAITAGTDGVMGRPGACHPGSRLIRNVPQRPDRRLCRGAHPRIALASAARAALLRHNRRANPLGRRRRRPSHGRRVCHRRLPPGARRRGRDGGHRARRFAARDRDARYLARRPAGGPERRPAARLVGWDSKSAARRGGNASCGTARWKSLALRSFQRRRWRFNARWTRSSNPRRGCCGGPHPRPATPWASSSNWPT